MPRKKKEPKPDVPKPPPKKRGRKPKKKDPADSVPKIPKKRGRKPKGGKIIKKENLSVTSHKNIQHNIILHLKCSMSDIDNNNYHENIEHFQFNENKIGDLNYEVINKKENIKCSSS